MCITIRISCFRYPKVRHSQKKHQLIIKNLTKVLGTRLDITFYRIFYWWLSRASKTNNQRINFMIFVIYSTTRLLGKNFEINFLVTKSQRKEILWAVYNIALHIMIRLTYHNVEYAGKRFLILIFLYKERIFNSLVIQSNTGKRKPVI